MTGKGKSKKTLTKAAQKALDEKAKQAVEEQRQRAQEALQHQETVIVPAVRELQARSSTLGIGTVYLLDPQQRTEMNRRVLAPQSAPHEGDAAESSRTGQFQRLSQSPVLCSPSYSHRHVLGSGKPVRSPRPSIDRPSKVRIGLFSVLTLQYS